MTLLPDKFKVRIRVLSNYYFLISSSPPPPSPPPPPPPTSPSPPSIYLCLGHSWSWEVPGILWPCRWNSNGRHWRCWTGRTHDDLSVSFWQVWIYILHNKNSYCSIHCSTYCITYHSIWYNIYHCPYKSINLPITGTHLSQLQYGLQMALLKVHLAPFLRYTSSLPRLYWVILYYVVL